MFLRDKKFIRFIIIFLGVFAVCYFGTLAVIGLSATGGRYSPFVAHYLNYVDVLRSSLLEATKGLLSLFGMQTERMGDYVLRVPGGRGIRMVYSCIGYGVMSFWVAYIAATTASVKKKIIWLLLGLSALWAINVIRLSLVLAANQNGWGMPFGWDHHTWFNIAAYGAIFGMIWGVERKVRRTNEEF